MSLGPLMVDIKGLELEPDEREMLAHPLVGGVILFSRNYASLEQLIDLIQAIHKIRSPRLIVAIDQEGGRVQRLREEFTRLPAVARLGQLYRQDEKYARHCAQTTGWLMAAECLAIGIDISFAPVLDLDYGVSTVIGDRAFHRSPEIVADLAHAYMIGMKKAGMMATGKHFPGHGAVHADSHEELPIDNRRYVDLLDQDLLPFERLIHFDIAAMMMAHVVYPDIDNRPASFSSIWIKDILRSRLGFEGVIFSDDLNMGGATGMGDMTERARHALAAGCDMILICNNPEASASVIEQLGEVSNPVSQLRLARMHGKPHADWQTLRASQAWQQATELLRAYEPEPLLDMDME